MDMQNVLTLTPDEKKIFDALSDALKDGWKVEKELPIPLDSPIKRLTRFELLHLRDETLMRLAEHAKKTQEADEIVKFIQEADLSKVSHDDLTELFFAIGPSVLSQAIFDLLGKVKTDDELRDIGALADIRHSLLDSNS